MVKWLSLLVLSVVIQYLALQLVRRLKMTQSIYELSPDSHQQKANTPSFGGIGILACIGIGTLMFGPTDWKTWWVVSITMTFGVIGFVDDYISLKAKTNKGLSARKKLFMQSCAALFFGLVALSLSPDMPLWMVVPLWFVIVGSSNATNLTDGLDGLLGGLSVITALGFAAYFHKFEEMGLTTLSLTIALSMGIFLLFNRHPAKIFMGDTGSLAVGAAFAGLAISSNNIWILVPLGAVYIIETLSVIVQVAVFKRTGNRLFLMAPIHHHFELMGLSERATVRLLYAIAAGFGLIFYYFYLSPVA